MNVSETASPGIQRIPATYRLKPAKISYYKSRLMQPGCLLMSLAARFYNVRRLYRTLSGLTRSRQLLLPSTIKNSLFPAVDTGKALAGLKRDGYTPGLNMPEELVDDILRFTERAICYGDRKGCYGFRVANRQQAETTYKKRFQQAQYSRPDLSNCQAIGRLERDPVLLSIAQDYLGGKPVHLTSRLFWSFADKKDSYDTQLNSTHYHYDLDDYGCLRFFFYLTDVDDANGPHAVIKGSHRQKKLSQILSKSHAVRNEDELLDGYGRDRVEIIHGKAGTGFAEDAMCFHKATRPQKGSRLLLQITFALNDYGLHGKL